MKNIIMVLSILLLYTGCVGNKMIETTELRTLSCEKNVVSPNSLELLEQRHRCSNN